MFKLIIFLVASIFLFACNKPGIPEDALERDALEYVKDMGVSLKEAKFRLGIQSEIGELNALLSQDKEHFGGLYIEHQPTYSINILLKDVRNTSEIAQLFADKTWHSLVKFRHVGSSHFELESAQNIAHKILTTLNIPATSSINVQENLVEVYVTDKGEFNSVLVANALKLPKEIKLIQIDTLSFPIPVKDEPGNLK